jgi:hypothetical protein
MTMDDHTTTAINLPIQTARSQHAFALFAMTLPAFLLAGVCFGWYGLTGEIPLLLLGLVTFGMAYDFLSHILGIYMRRHQTFLRWYAKVNYWALCFGIPFTAFAGTFVIAEIKPDSLSASLANNYLVILWGSVLFGLLFLFARYKQITIAGSTEYVLDKRHPYTKTIFILRRILLALSLAIGILVMFDGWGTSWQLWSIVFGVSFIITVPLHIMHLQIPSMLSELATQFIAIYATWQIFVNV